jgi:hypothetical protein
MSRQTFMSSLMGSIGAQHGTEDELLGVWDICGESIAKAAADAMAADVTALTKVWCNPYPFSIYLINAIITPAATLTAHDTNNASVLLLTDNAADGTPAAAATWLTATTGTGNWATDIGVRPSSYTAANRILLPGANLFWQITKASAGVVVPIMRIVPVFRKLG